MRARIALVALALKLLRVDHVEINGHALGINEAGRVIAQKAKDLLAEKLHMDPSRNRIGGSGHSDPLIGFTVSVYGPAAAPAGRTAAAPLPTAPRAYA